VTSCCDFLSLILADVYSFFAVWDLLSLRVACFLPLEGSADDAPCAAAAGSGHVALCTNANRKNDDDDEEEEEAEQAEPRVLLYHISRDDEQVLQATKLGEQPVEGGAISVGWQELQEQPLLVLLSSSYAFVGLSAVHKDPCSWFLK